jgi:hypothetical protein
MVTPSSSKLAIQDHDEEHDEDIKKVDSTIQLSPPVKSGISS